MKQGGTAMNKMLKIGVSLLFLTGIIRIIKYFL